MQGAFPFEPSEACILSETPLIFMFGKPEPGGVHCWSAVQAPLVG
jgi:hypothetical protein